MDLGGTVREFHCSMKAERVALGRPRMRKEIEVETLLTFAECNMSTSETARKLYCTHGTVKYRLGRIKERTGLDPHRFYDLVELVRRYNKGR